MSSKVKLRLVQPEIKCSGRDDVTCYYRGKIIAETEHGILIRFKYKGSYVEGLYGENGFEDPELQDIKIV